MAKIRWYIKLTLQTLCTEMNVLLKIVINAFEDMHFIIEEV